ncbi:carbon-nitrogen hydrolase family protein [Roseovarius sp. SCSIO 43702]|uniref:carbon-nitrogen hydrolase family protein n=1 Tax=Roseovarius sp. SCSIO 43702 TaxID=2823043 RepID=UPI001C73BF77|nr:carbon-nitrogen hydrolase family protein [Roseovarius sp. SCSIO 43702]QYX55262.1 carbon-nitrogen hydrolase family protein [Roseovarius sp. SCSIO 43702]
MARHLHIACLQTPPVPDFDAALEVATSLAETAAGQGAEMLFLPEYCGGLRTANGRLAPPVAAEEDHPVLAGLSELAARLGVWINVGSIAIEGPGDKFLNRGYMIDDAGRIRGRYDKIHLFDVTLSEDEIYRESDSVAPGCKAIIHDTPKARIGHTICYDLRFPELFRRLAQGGAEILVCPAAFTRLTGAAHWHVLNRARAIETTRFVVSACAAGDIAGGGGSYGHSLIVSPWGEMLAEGGDAPGVVSAVIDLEQVRATEARIPSLANGRDFAPAETTKTTKTIRELEEG